MGERAAAFRVRPATAADAAGIERLLRELDGLHARIQPSFFRPPRGAGRGEPELRRTLGRSDELVLLALPAAPAAPAAGGEPEETLGLVHLRVQPTPPSPSMVQARRAYIEELVVARRARRRGCGRLLMKEATRWARDRGAEQLVLTVWTGNEEAAAFYARLGYRTVSTVLAVDLSD